MGTPITDLDGNTANPFQFGVGHILPSTTIDPVLVNNTYTNCRAEEEMGIPSFRTF